MYQYAKGFKCTYCSGFVKCINTRRVLNVYTVVGLLNVSIYEGFKCIYCSGFVKCINIRRVLNVYTVVGLLNVSIYEWF